MERRSDIRATQVNKAAPNKELKLTKPGTIGASQLNSSVRHLLEG